MRTLLPFIALFLAVGSAGAQTISITGPDRLGMLEGETYVITWEAGGLESVSIVAHGTRTPLGTQSRGNFSIAVVEGVSAGAGSAEWTVPWIDSITFFIKAKGYASDGRQVPFAERGFRFRPSVMADRMEDGIYLDLSKRTNQRLYRQQDYRITRAYFTSSSEAYHWRPPGSHISSPHDHAGVFSVLEKRRMHWSTLFNVQMPWAMRYHGGHFTHATSRNLYRNLGMPASAGCNRMTNHDAREIYRMTPLGSRLEVVGPDG